MQGNVGRSALLAMLLLVAGCHQEPAAPMGSPGATGLRLLGGEAGSGFALATEPRDFAFPEDHGSHAEYRTEWWYFTGNLATESKRHFGFELTFFRYALAPLSEVGDRPSAWRTRQVWMAHFALTDTAGRRFEARQRLVRDGLGLAGATAEPLRVWVRDWEAVGTASDEDLAIDLRARDDGMALALELKSTMAPVPQGDGGLDAKGPGRGNASYYYSVPRLAATGEITLDGEASAVTGLAWLDREWSTSALEAGLEGWDWFALHLSDGSSLMFYRLRTAEGTSSPYSGGALIGPTGERLALDAAAVVLDVLDHWTSDSSGVRYPVAWALRIPEAGLALEIRPYVEAQELNLAVRYWEGAVQVVGSGPNGALDGEGYLELAGY